MRLPLTGPTFALAHACARSDKRNHPILVHCNKGKVGRSLHCAARALALCPLTPSIFVRAYSIAPAAWSAACASCSTGRSWPSLTSTSGSPGRRCASPTSSSSSSSTTPSRSTRSTSRTGCEVSGKRKTTPGNGTYDREHARLSRRPALATGSRIQRWATHATQKRRHHATTRRVGYGGHTDRLGTNERVQPDPLRPCSHSFIKPSAVTRTAGTGEAPAKPHARAGDQAGPGPIGLSGQGSPGAPVRMT